MSNALPLQLKITRIVKHTPGIWSFFMHPAEGPRPDFQAGQVAVLEMADHQPTYIAFASAPEEAEYEFLIKRSTTPNVSSALFEPQIAEPILLQQIIGRGFPIEDYIDHDLVFVAMGTGLAPLRSALRHLFHQRENYGRLIVLYGARTLDDFCFEEEMDNEWRAHGVELRQVLSQPNDEWSGPTGYVQGLLDHIIPELQQPVALVCGSPKMMAETKDRLVELGFAPEKILTNY
jgi:NAD(P)H-flavin reductase